MFLKKVLVLLAMVSLLTGLGLFAADAPHKEPMVKKGAETISIKGVTRSWKDVEQTPLNMRTAPRRLRPVTNFDRGLEIVHKDAQEDPVVQKDFGMLKRGMKSMSDPTASFDGLNLSSNGSGWPPDTTGDVGPTYYIQAVNSSFGIYRKSDGNKMYSATFDAFFGGTGISGTPCDSENNGDPIVLYDRYNERWFILDFAWNPSKTDGSYFSIAVTKTSDPTGDWWQYAFRADNTLMDDYPKAGVWHDGIYITANMFSFSNNSFQHAKIWAIKTPDIYNGTLTSQSTTDSGTMAFALLPSNAKSATPPSSSAPNYMYAKDASEWGSGHSDALYVWKYDVNWTNSSNTTWTGPTKITAATYSLSSTGISQSGTSNKLDTLYGRLMYAAPYMNYGTHESIYLSHSAISGSTWGMRWYEIRLSGGSSSIYQQSTYAPDSNDRWMGSVAADGNGGIALGYSVSSSSMYPGIRYAGRLASDPLGSLSQGENTLISGGGSQTSYSRWGDYSTLSIDPSDDETFWYTQEYLTSTGTSWKTRIGAFKINGTIIIPSGDIAEAVDYDTLSFTDSGDADWSVDTSDYYYDSDSAKSGTITHSQTSSIETTLTVPSGKDISFYWKVSSEAGYDYLRFYIDGTLQDQIAGSTSWAQKTYSVAAGSHTLKWTYYKDGSVSSNSDCGWVDKLELVDGTVIVGDPLGEALDDSSQTVTTSGDGTWAVNTSTYYYGSSSLKSPTLTHSEDASFQTTVSGVTSVSFYWKVSSESSYDYLNFYIDGTRQDRISGTVNWTQQTYSVSSGSHTLKWTYDKDYSVSSGSDCGWVDRLQLN
ncbi:MAG: hypothetical protein GY765_26480 [bacterium]|nr:hypothetical protein [bacterium]